LQSSGLHLSDESAPSTHYAFDKNMLAVACTLSLLYGCALGSRINLKAQLVDAHTREKQSANDNMKAQIADVHALEKHSANASDGTAWMLSMSGVPCYLSDDLKQLGPFATGIKGSWNAKGLAGTILSEGRKLASKNCKLCNIQVMGSVVPFQLGDIKPQVSAIVESAAEDARLSVGCFRGDDTNLGKFAKGSALGVCAPCPQECEGGCADPGPLDFGYGSTTWFKCRTNDPKKIANAAKRGSTDKLVNVFSSRFECEGTKYKRLKSDVQEVIGEADGEALKPTFYKSKKEGQWKLYCKYKDFAASLDEETRSPLAVEGSSWAFNSGITACSDVREVSQEGFIANLAKAASPKLQEQAINQNCNVCESSFGGLLQTLVQSEDAGNLLDMTGKELEGSEPLWMKAECAIAELGLAACSLGKGPVGWAKTAPCLPCPEECMSCEADESQLRKNVFKCALKPIVSFPTPALTSMTDTVSLESNTLAQDLYKLPEGLTCTQPVPRKCSRKKTGDWCKPWQFKTVCSFGSLGNPSKA